VSTCGTCKHWEKGDYFDDEKYWGECHRIRQYRGGDNPVAFYDPDTGRQMFDPDEVVSAQDGSAYFAAIRCKAQFGCILYEEAYECKP
jgi:hypothetical protein